MNAPDDTLLMLFGETRHCDDCEAATIFLPVEDAGPDEVWICTSCDTALLIPAPVSAA